MRLLSGALVISAFIISGWTHTLDKQLQMHRLPGVPPRRYRWIPLRWFAKDIYDEGGEAVRRRLLRVYAIAQLGGLLGMMLFLIGL